MGFGVVSLLDAVFRRMFTSAGLRQGSATVDAAADTTIHYWAHPSLLQQPPPSGSERRRRPPPVVVLIHGFGPDPTWQWAAQMGPLSRHFHLVVPTLLFFGASATRAPARSDAFQAAALAALLSGQHLPGLGAGRTVHVVGTSYGGLVAYHLARELEQQQQERGGVLRVGKVALCDSDACKGAEDDRALAARGGVAEVAELLAPADTRALRRLMAVCAHRPVKYVPECLLRDMLRRYFADKREEKIALIEGITTGEGFELAPLPQGVLIIWGEFDQIFPVESTQGEREARGEGDGEGDPQHGAPAAAGGPQALQPNPPRFPAAPYCFHLGCLQWQRRCQIARLFFLLLSCCRARFQHSSLLLMSPRSWWSGDAAFFFLYKFWPLQAGFEIERNADECSGLYRSLHLVKKSAA